MPEKPEQNKPRFEAVFIIGGKNYKLTNKRKIRGMRVVKKKGSWERK